MGVILVDRLTKSRKRGGTLAAQGFGRVADATEFDPNSVAAFADAANGYTITMANTAAGRDTPATGAVLSWAGIPDMSGEDIEDFYPNFDVLRMRLYERLVPATAPSQIRVAFGFSDNADPTLATSGIFWGLDYATVSGANPLRRTLIIRCSAAGTWTATTATTGQVDCFGVDGTYLPFSTQATDEQNGLPVNSLGDLHTVGSNSARFATTYNPSPWPTWTHRHLFVGWIAGTGNNGDVIRVDGDFWAHGMPARAA